MSTILPASLVKVSKTAADLLHVRKETVSFAETAAAGLLTTSLLAQPGSSKIFTGGLVLYTLQSRILYAGWTQADIDAYRGPSADLVAGIAKHVNVNGVGGTYTVCESGTAGPTGGNTRGRTPGFVALAVVAKGEVAKTREVETGSSDREGNMVRFAEEAYRLLIEVIQEQDGSGEKL